MRVLRVYHAGRDNAQRARERALCACGIELTLVVPATWPGDTDPVDGEEFEIVELPVRRPGDVNRHRYDEDDLVNLIRRVRPAVLDLHEEPFSAASHQFLRVAPRDMPITMYAAQNIDKRLPPPFAQFERRAYRRVAAIYPCSRQAASVARGKGFEGLVEILPLGFDESLFTPGRQSVGGGDSVLGFVGRLVPEKGLSDAIEILARCNQSRPARLLVVGDGPERQHASARARALGVADRVEFLGWKAGADLAALYRQCHIVLVPSKPTSTWVEQFGRVIVEAQASGAVVAGYASGATGEVAGPDALLAEVGDVDGLARHVADLLGSPTDFAKGQDGGVRMSRERTWAYVAQSHLLLYEYALRRPLPPKRRSRSPSIQRAAAQREFGPPAAAAAGPRPFALPLLRRGGTLAASLAWVIDKSAELTAP